MTKVNGLYNGIMYINCETIDTSLQPYCPLENTELEGYCQNEYHNVQLRSDSPCAHSDYCFELKAAINSNK